MEIKDQTIGLFHDWDRDWLITVHELKEEMLNEMLTVYTAKEYCDRRYTTNLERFNADPYTGEKINWKKVYNYLISKTDE